MAVSKKNKRIKQKEIPRGKTIVQGGDPNQYYSQNPAWTFANVDQEMWAFSQEHIGEMIWSEIFPRLKALETQTWREILVNDKKQNHLLELDDLNKVAQNRLYGYMSGRVFNVLKKEVAQMKEVKQEDRIFFRTTLLNQIQDYLNGSISKEEYYNQAEPFFTKYADAYGNPRFNSYFTDTVALACLYYIDEPGLSPEIREEEFREVLQEAYIQLQRF